ncbi:MAG: thymidine kinase [Oscillospiraceae bacterium]|nr:thymidine kinase [Oscillospiraceae bacterium]
MAKLYFRYGVMGSSKSANALMVRYNYEERGQQALMVKPAMDQREGESVVNSRIGLNYACVWFEDLEKMSAADIRAYQCVIVDEAQFLSHAQVDYLTEIVDDMNVPVICYGLRADFSGRLFPGSEALLACADIIEEVKTICWCGKKAICNARFDENGVVLKEGEQVVLGANDCYIGLCRKHWKAGDLGPERSAEPS